jgi:transposase
MRRVDGADGLPPQHTSDTCSRYGWVEGGIKGSTVFICKRCGLTNLYLRMEGISTTSAGFVIPLPTGGLVPPDEKGRGTDQFVRRAI